MLFLVYIVAYVFWYVLASAAIDEIAVSEMLPELLRNPQLLITPGVFGNSASQLIAVYNAAATVTLFAYFGRRRRVPAVPTGEIGAVADTQVVKTVRSAYDVDRATLIGVSSVAAGLFMLLTGWGWSEVAIIGDWKAFSVAMAATVVALLLWYRFWRIVSDGASATLRDLAAHGFMSGMLTFNNGLFALCALLTLCVAISRPFGMMGAYVAVLGVPLALLSYLLIEGWMFFARMQSRAPRVTSA